jgi:hypothetical protein
MSTPHSSVRGTVLGTISARKSRDADESDQILEDAGDRAQIDETMCPSERSRPTLGTQMIA